MRHMLGLTMNCTCNKSDILLQLKNNRSTHEKNFLEAKAGYVKKARELLENKLLELSTNDLVDLTFSLPKPNHYLSEYDTVIQMLEMHVDESIVLSADEFRMFVQDEWDWKEKFMAINSSYI